MSIMNLQILFEHHLKVKLVMVFNLCCVDEKIQYRKVLLLFKNVNTRKTIAYYYNILDYGCH